MTDNNNKQLIRYEKTHRNRINKRFNKMLLNLNKTKLHFDNLDDEIKFLNQIYFLNKSLQNVEANIEGVNEILNNIRNKEKVEINFTERIIEDNWNREIINNLASMVFLTKEDED
jgi:hypothetical protein